MLVFGSVHFLSVDLVLSTHLLGVFLIRLAEVSYIAEESQERLHHLGCIKPHE